MAFPTVCDSCGGYGLLHERGLKHERDEALDVLRDLVEALGNGNVTPWSIELQDALNRGKALVGEEEKR